MRFVGYLLESIINGLMTLEYEQLILTNRGENILESKPGRISCNVISFPVDIELMAHRQLSGNFLMIRITART